MTYTDYYVTATFIIMLFFIKNYYDKYSNSTILIKNFIKEINKLNTEIELLSNLKIALENKANALQGSNDSNLQMIEHLKSEMLQIKQNFNLDKDLLKKSGDHQI